MMIDKNLPSYEAQQMDELCFTRGIYEKALYKDNVESCELDFCLDWYHCVISSSRDIIQLHYFQGETFNVTFYICVLFKRPLLVLFSTCIFSSDLYSSFLSFQATSSDHYSWWRPDGGQVRWFSLSMRRRSEFKFYLNNQCFCKNILESEWTFVFFRKNIIGIFPANYVKCIQMRETGSEDAKGWS